MEFSLIETIALSAVPVVLAITLHEAAHGYVARQFGDSTAWMLGRVTLNPLKHIDPVGTVLVPLSILLLSGGGFLFGWAKPVPVNFGSLRHPKRDMLWVAAAGPGVNFAMALAWTLLYGAVAGGDASANAAIGYMSLIGIGINVSLMVLNLLPILPLDGGRIAVSLLPHSLALPFARTERIGFFIVLFLLLVPGVNVAFMKIIMRPLANAAFALLEAVTGVNLPNS